MSTEYTLTSRQTGETQQVTCCDQHARAMPDVDGDRVRVCLTEADCELCKDRAEA